MIDNITLRSAFSKFSTGISVLTITDDQGELYGVTINSFSSVSLDPALALWSLGDATYVLEKFLKTDSYIINVLSNNQEQVSNNFAAQGEFDRFEAISYSVSDQGIPLLNDCLARFYCRKFKVERVGDHWLFIGEILNVDENKGEPLIYFNSSYRSLAAI